MTTPLVITRSMVSSSGCASQPERGGLGSAPHAPRCRSNGGATNRDQLSVERSADVVFREARHRGARAHQVLELGELATVVKGARRC